MININFKTIGEKTQIVPYTNCKRNPKLTLIFEPKSRQMNPVGTQMNPNWCQRAKPPPLPKSPPIRVPFGIILGSIWDTQSPLKKPCLMVKLLETQNEPKNYPKLEPNKNPKVTQKLPKLGINWVHLGSNRVPLGSPERVPLGSSWVPFGFPLGSSWVQLKKKPKSYPILSVNGCQH